MFKNRLTYFVETGIKRGNRFFIAHGEGVRDFFYYSFYRGALTPMETFKKFFFNKQKIDVFIHTKGNQINVYENENSQALHAENFLETSADDLEDMELNPAAPGNNKADTAVERTKEAVGKGTDVENKWSIILNEVTTKPEKQFAMFCEEFDWTVGLYNSNQDATIGFIKKVRDLAKLNNICLVLSLNDIEKLRPFDFPIEGKHTMMIANPTADEVEFAYLRRYFKKYALDAPVPNNLLVRLRNVAEAVSSSKKSLREALHILEGVIREKGAEFNRDDFKEAIEKIVEENISMDNVKIDKAKITDVRKMIQDFVDGKSKDKGFILTGPPGTGKTYLVKALANEFNCYLEAPSLADLKGEYVGQTSPKIKRLFDTVRANEPAIIFIDEADTIFPSRNLTGSGYSDSFNLDMVNQFLVEIDGLTTGKQRVFVIAATNRVGVLDNAISSRLKKRIEIPLPGKEMRILLLKEYLQPKGLVFDNLESLLDYLADKTEMMSGRDIKNFAEEVERKCQENNLNLRDITADSEEVRNSFNQALKETENIKIDELERELNVKVHRPTINENNSRESYYDDIIGYDEVKAKIKDFAWQMREGKKLHEKGVTREQGIILYGPPGNGKSEIAKATAQANNMYFIKIVSRTLISDSLTKYIDNINKVFQYAVQLSKISAEDSGGVLLFFDEFDSLASNEVLSKAVRGTFLNCLDNKSDGIRHPGAKVLLMAATNFYEKIDEAVARPGRFDEKLLMNNPTEKEGIRILLQKSQNDVSLLEDTARKAYECQVKLERKNIVEREYKKFANNINLTIDMFVKASGTQGAVDFTKLKELLEEQYKNETLSGVQTKNLYDALKRVALRCNSMDNDGKLLISDNIVDTYFKNDCFSRG